MTFIKLRVYLYIVHALFDFLRANRLRLPQLETCHACTPEVWAVFYLSGYFQGKESEISTYSNLD